MRGVVVAATLLAACACSSGNHLGDGPSGAGDGPASTTSVTSSASPTTTAPLATAVASLGGVTVGRFADDPAVHAYARYLEARFAAFRRRDTRYAPLLRLSTAHRAAFDRARIDRMVRDGETYEGRVRFVIVAAATTGDTARLRACERDDASWFVRRDGTRSPTKPQWLPLDVRMVHTSGAWKVDDTLNAKFSCAEAR
jgi:hypothetical protein